MATHSYTSDSLTSVPLHKMNEHGSYQRACLSGGSCSLEGGTPIQMLVASCTPQPCPRQIQKVLFVCVCLVVAEMNSDRIRMFVGGLLAINKNCDLFSLARMAQRLRTNHTLQSSLGGLGGSIACRTWRLKRAKNNHSWEGDRESTTACWLSGGVDHVWNATCWTGWGF